MKYLILLFVALFFTACDEELVPPVEGKLFKLEIDSPETITIPVGSSRTLGLRGLYVASETQSVTNTGILQSVTYYHTSSDSSYVTIANSSAEWYSGNYSIATVYNGIVQAKSRGTTFIYAKSDGITSADITVIVN